MEAVESAAARRRAPEGSLGVAPRQRIVGSGGLAPLLLIADDVEESRALYAESFGELGFRTAEAVDGEHALFKIASMMPSLVVMDISMPILDGIETTKKIRGDAKTTHLPVVVLAGHATPENVQRAKSAGADAVLTKPCTPEELLVVVRRLLKI